MGGADDKFVTLFVKKRIRPGVCEIMAAIWLASRRHKAVSLFNKEDDISYLLCKKEIWPGVCENASHMIWLASRRHQAISLFSKED